MVPPMVLAKKAVIGGLLHVLKLWYKSAFCIKPGSAEPRPVI